MARFGVSAGSGEEGKSLAISADHQMAEFKRALFGLLLVAFVPVSSAVAQQKPLTAREVIGRIQAHVGIPWQSDTVDTFKAGNPDIPVTGIAVTMMATLDVLKRAAASGNNLVITHEPTFFSHLDKPDELAQGESDPVLAEKRAFIQKHGLLIWRFHDHWHARTPDGIQAGMVHALGWEKFQDPGNEHLFTVPQTTVEALAAELKARLGIRAMRVVGKPDMQVTRVAMSPGAAGFGGETRALEMPVVQVLVVGETREWETVEYVADAVTEGKHKALIILGHIPSEQAGMEECTRWLKSFVTEVPVSFVPAPEPFGVRNQLREVKTEANNYVDFTARYFEIFGDERGGDFGAAYDSGASGRVCAPHGGSGKSCYEDLCTKVFRPARIQDVAKSLPDHHPRRSRLGRRNRGRCA
jgi:putative NIF3 family GTP cyclohydrolase 1 type 2